MNKLIFTTFFLVVYNLQIFSQEVKQFQVIKILESTFLKDQQSSGTCWSFATTSFIETEALRLGHDTVSLSPIFYVIPTYLGKAEKFIKEEGGSFFDAGDLTFSVLEAYEKYGAIPENIYNGIIDGDWQHDHVEMDNLLSAMVESVGNSGYGRVKPESWRKSIEGVLHSYLGKAPKTFIYKSEEHTPKTFADKFVGIRTDDYIEITSYDHFKYYVPCVLDIPANWRQGKYLNVPISDFEMIINKAIENGFSLAWDGDASEPNFNFNSGILRLTEDEENKIITQELRQRTFEDNTTTDDHNMHIVGVAKDEHNKIYYIMKNSEGQNDLGGYIYMSKKSLLLKTISVLVHKDAIPESIKVKIRFPKKD